MKRRTAASALVTLTAGAALAVLPAGAAQAHPLGNFTVSQYDGLVVAPGKLAVDHVEDLAEIPAARERGRIDADGDDDLGSAELSAWARTRCEAAARDARLTVKGKGKGSVTGGGPAGGGTVPVSAGSAKAQVQPGQAGLKTLRVTCALTAPLPREGGVRLAYRPASVTTTAGWREITARGDRMTLSASDVPGKSLSRRLTAYPGDVLSTPPEVRSAALTVRAGGPALVSGGDDGGGSPAAGVLPRGADRWAQALTGLVARHELTAGFAALALGMSLFLGAMHALAPGHGKTMMAAAAAAGGRSSVRDMVGLGLSVTMTHTLGVFALGALITAGSAAAPTVVSWLGIASGALVAVAGALLLRRAWRQRHRPHTHGHSHGHGHTHVHTQGHGHPHGQGPAHSHDADAVPVHAEERTLVSVASSTSAVPGLAADVQPPAKPSHKHEHKHEHGHEHGHGHGHEQEQEHDRGSADVDEPVPVASPGHSHPHHSHPHPHSHTHSHLPPAPGLRGVVLLGFAGGLVPSPSAVVVLVGAAALGQAWFGFLLVLAYGAGLALTLTGAGFAAVRLRETTARRLTRRPRGRFLVRAQRAAPLGTAAVVFVLGCGLLLRGAATALG
ncbi:sulfite exporter TauE/SafE family protein [Streptomyces agglomeratus]|uniref:urease accessory protein UreH domain-containing protein n=1 Tax=Streptomyces agglomeratus TaxID=285458 RepID=UPI000854E025|nr:sulfite exporter TauE/SafE family protein [Streptomyces agglomeratus]OEJ49898.1 nickel transporter [Streptomyces agglomeratus]